MAIKILMTNLIIMGEVLYDFLMCCETRLHMKQYQLLYATYSKVHFVGQVNFFANKSGQHVSVAYVWLEHVSTQRMVVVRTDSGGS